VLTSPTSTAHVNIEYINDYAYLSHVLQTRSMSRTSICAVMPPSTYPRLVFG
jgi:hypothetical protein